MENTKYYYFYMHKNMINGKVYIGETSTNPKDRWKNGKNYKTCTYFNRAIEKYGWDNFEHIILEEGLFTIDEAIEREKYWIQQYDARNPLKGYNINDGGFTTISPLALQRAEEWKKKHPEVMLSRAKIMQQWQMAHPEEILEMRKINAKKAAQKRKIPTICIETNEIFESATAAAKYYGLNPSHICQVCRNQRVTCGEKHWKYYMEDNYDKK